MNNAKRVASIQPVPFLLLFLLAISPLLTLCESEVPQAFDFLRHLKGCHKGQTVRGLSELKRYLKRFGYVSVQDSLRKHARDDAFDEALESQIRSYQLNYHLNPSGILDAETVRKMMMPRCGIADNVRATIPMMRSRNGKHRTLGGQRSTNCTTELNVSAFSFFPGEPKWSKTELTYAFSCFATDIDPTTQKAVLESAFAKWAAVSVFSFNETTSPMNSDVIVGVHRRDHGDGAPFDGPGGVLAHAFAPSVGWLHYDADEKWSTNPDQSQFDFETVAIHEMGHVLGLGHSTEPQAIMYPFIQAGTKKRTLHQNDADGIQALYA